MSSFLETSIDFNEMINKWKKISVEKQTNKSSQS